MSSIYRVLAEHARRQAYPEAVGAAHADFAALQTVGSIPGQMAGSLSAWSTDTIGPRALPFWAPFPGRTAPSAAAPDDDDTAAAVEEPATAVPAPTDGSER
ncbi:hypothetical protein [Streptomyces sp. 8N706]|uniref:hypothetical protein n=1 Tax=Streptomyces sp. 8N706 TaxID=3457416 RepID=UPI003FD3194A